MKRQWKEDSRYKYCVLGPHRIATRGHKISSVYLYPSFKAYVGESWTVYHPEAELCNKCQAKVRNFGRQLEQLPDSSVPVPASEEYEASATPAENELIEDSEILEVGDICMQATSSESCSIVSESSFYTAQDITPRSHSCMSSHHSGVSSHYSGMSSHHSGVSSSSHYSGLASHCPGSEASLLEDIPSSSATQTRYQLTSMTACTLSQRYCMICGEEGKDSRHRIPKKVVRNLWHERKILASTECRSCPFHHDGSQFSESAISNLEASVRKRTIYLDEGDLYNWVAAVTNCGGSSPKYMFDVDGVPASQYSSLVGISKESFDDLLSYIQADMRNSCNRSKRQALAMWLMLMKSGLTQEHLAMDFDVEQKTVSNACKVVGDLIHKYFTPLNLGFQSISKEDVIANHNRTSAQIALTIPEGKVIAIADGTYLYVDKPVGHSEQRLAFNAQKMCNFYRMMMIVACSGHILDCIGPFPATWNDSRALEWVMENTGFLDFLGDGTVILDRGFKSCEPKLREKGLTVYSPEWLGPNEKQMSVEKGAKSRLVTMCRWQVEGANGKTQFLIIYIHKYF